MTETTRTREQLRNEAADKLRVLGPGESLDGEDGDKIDKKIDPLLLELAAGGICDVADDSEIPAEWFDAIADLLANRCALDFGKQQSEPLRMAAEDRLKTITRRKAVRNRMLKTDPILSAGFGLRRC